MTDQRRIGVNDNAPLKERMERAFPSPRTMYGNPIENISGKWLRGEEYLYVGRSKEGFHAATAIPGHDYTLAFGKAFPTAKDAAASFAAPKKNKTPAERFGRQCVKNAPTKKPPSRSR